jgi:ATP-binding cassette subfamily B protein
MAAARQAHIDAFVDSLPKGYDTEINEDSTNISAGQKQLLTIARAYLSDRPILILDEATSNVDTRTELLIQKTMDNLMQGRTAFVIAHRLSTIENADVILVIDNGKIVEQGRHEELLSRSGLYSKIYNSQYPSIRENE